MISLDIQEGDFASSPAMERIEAPSFNRVSIFVRSERVRCLPFGGGTGFFIKKQAPFVMQFLASVKKALDYEFICDRIKPYKGADAVMKKKYRVGCNPKVLLFLSLIIPFVSR